MPMPGIDWLSMWSMSLTVVLSTRSYGVMIRPVHVGGRKAGVLPGHPDDRHA